MLLFSTSAKYLLNWRPNQIIDLSIKNRRISILSHCWLLSFSYECLSAIYKYHFWWVTCLFFAACSSQIVRFIRACENYGWKSVSLIYCRYLHMDHNFRFFILLEQLSLMFLYVYIIINILLKSIFKLFLYLLWTISNCG